MSEKFKKGDIVVYNTLPFYFVSYSGQIKYGDGPYKQQCIICPLRKGTLLPDKRVLNGRWLRFKWEVLEEKLTLYE